MSDIALSVENISKIYRLGELGTGTISQDLNSWWFKLRGRENPNMLVGSENDRTKKDADSDFVYALKDISFEVKEGEVLGIIGKNGAGKSTLLKVISRITSPSEGIIKAKGRMASLLEVGTGMHPEMTARENIFLNGAILGMSKNEIKKKFDEIIDFAGCNLYVDTPVKRFSSGMRVRLGFAVAAFLEPEILIVDEVLAVGDAEFQSKAIGKMQDVSKSEGRTVLFVSHNMASVKSLCSSAMFLKNGMVNYTGSSSEVVDYYLNHEEKVLEDENIPLDFENRISDGTAQYTKMRIIDHTGRKNNRVYFREPFEVQFEASFHKKLSNIFPVVKIKDPEGNYALIQDNTRSQPKGLSFEEGEYQLKMKFDLNLLPGNYSFDISLSDINGATIDFVPNVQRITIEKAGFDKGLDYKWTKNWGVLYNNNEIEILRK